MYPSKEWCDMMLSVLHRNGPRLPADDYNRLYRFLKTCRGRLPTQAAIERDAERVRHRRKATNHPEQ
jgi:hypothetical protein